MLAIVLVFSTVPAIGLLLLVVSRLGGRERRFLQILMIVFGAWVAAVAVYVIIVASAHTRGRVQVRNNSSESVEISGGAGGPHTLTAYSTAERFAIPGVSSISITLGDGRVVVFRFTPSVKDEFTSLTIEQAGGE